MSAALTRLSQPEKAPIPGPGPLLSLVAAAIFPFDRVLAGMVAAGQGIEAICLYLCLGRAALDDALVRLGLQTPHDRPLRRGGPKAWSVLDTMRLIFWRVACIHPATIAERLTAGGPIPRSVGAVRAKLRRLGIPAPPRRELRRPDIATLVDPEPGFVYAAAAAAPTRADTPNATDLCGTAAGPAWTRTEAPSAVVVPLSPGGVSLHPAAVTAGPVTDAPAGRRGARRANKAAAQRELQLFRVAPAGGTEQAPGDKEIAATEIAATEIAAPVARIIPPQPVAPSHPDPAVRAAGDLSWIAGLRRIETNEEAVLLISMRYFGGQNWRQIAEAVGDKVARIRTALTRVWLPRDHDRKKFCATYCVEQARATVQSSVYELIRDDVTRCFFWRDRRKRAIFRVSRETRRARGQVDEYDRYKSQLIALAPRQPAEMSFFGTPFAGMPATLSA